MAINLPTHRDQRAAENNSGSSLVNKMFDPGVDYLIPSSKKTYEVRILPPRDPQLKNTPQYATSVAPYRFPQTPEELAAGLPGAMSDWCLPIRFYAYYGPGNNMLILSPLSSVPGRYPEATTIDERDPIYDVNQKAFRMKEERPEWFELTKSPTGDYKDKPVLQRFRNGYLISAAWREANSSASREWSVGLLLLSDLGANRLFDTLNEKRAAEEPLIGPKEFGRYLLNDITHPETGLRGMLTQQEVKIETGAKLNTWLVNFSTAAGTLNGVQKLPLSEIACTRNGKRVSALEARYDIQESITPLTYMELLDLLVQQPAVPEDLIYEACGPYIGYQNIPKRTIGSSGQVNTATPKPVAQPQQPSNDDLGMDQLPMEDPKPSAPAVAPPAAPPVAPPPAPAPEWELQLPERLQNLYFTIAGKQSGPYPRDVAGKEFLSALKQTGADLTKTAAELLENVWFFSTESGIQEWKSATDLGIALAKKEVAPPPAPAAPAAPAPTMPPPPPVADAGAGDPDAALIAEYKALSQRAEDASTSSDPLTTDEVDRLMHLSQVLGDKVG